MLRVPAAHPAALRCLRLAVPRLRGRVACPALRPLPPLNLAVAAGLGISKSAGCPIPAMVVETTGIPRFLGNPRVDVPCSSTPAGPVGQAIFGPSGAAFRSRYVVGSRDVKILSGLNHTAHPLAVYASQPGLLPDHARLASGCWPALPGGIDYPLGSNARFSSSCCTSLPRLFLAHTVAKLWLFLYQHDDIYDVADTRNLLLRFGFAAS